MPSTRPQTNIRLDDTIRAMADDLQESTGILSLSGLVRHLIVSAHRERFPGQPLPEKKSPKRSGKGLTGGRQVV